MKIVVGAVAYITNGLHLEFAQRTLDSIKTKYDTEILIFPNASRGGDREKLRLPYPGSWLVQFQETPVSVAAAWNCLIRNALAKEADYILIPNLDIIFHPHCIDNLITFAEQHPEFLLWSAAAWSNYRTIFQAAPSTNSDIHPHFSCFMINVRTIEEVGWFDEEFKGAYMEDLDYHLRILQAGFEAAKTATSWFYHFGSRTIECDPELKRRNLITHQSNREYFEKKYGISGDGRGAHEIYEELKRRESVKGIEEQGQTEDQAK